MLIQRFYIGNAPHKEFPKGSLIEKRSTQDSEYIKRTSPKSEIIFNNCNRTISRNSDGYLYSDRILRYSPKGFYMQMLFNPSEEQLHLPTVFIHHGDVFSLDFKVVGKICKCLFKFFGIIYNTPEKAWVLQFCLRTSKTDRLIKDYIIGAFKQLISFDDFILQCTTLPDNKVGTDIVNSIKFSKVKVAPIENVICIRFIWNHFHCLHIVQFSLSDMNKCRNLSDYIKKCVHLNARLSFTKACPPKKTQAQIGGCRVKRIKSTLNFKLPGEPLVLSHANYLIERGFKNSIIELFISLCQITVCNNRLTKSEMVGFSFMSGYKTNQLTKAVASGKLTVHHDQQLVPAAESLYIFITLVWHYYLLKSLLWKKFHNLREYIFPGMHRFEFALLSKCINSNRGQGLFNVTCIDTDNYKSNSILLVDTRDF